MRRFVVSILVLAGIGAIVKSAFPDVARYVKMRAM